jgi:hypothetical protein
MWMRLLRARWWRARRRVLAWLADRYSDGSTLINVWLHESRAIVPRDVPWWLRWLR